MPHDPFYTSRPWFAARARVLRRDGWCCVLCGADVRAKGAARVDHIRPRASHPQLALTLENLRTLCARCDNQRHSEKKRAIKEFGCDADGKPRAPEHPWNKP